MRGLEVLHVYSNHGGVHDYSIVVNDLLRAKGVSVVGVEVPMNVDTSSSEYEAANLKIQEFSSAGKNIHYEIGLNDIPIFCLLKNNKPAKNASNNVIVTIHDPRKVVHSTALDSENSLFKKITHKFIGTQLRSLETRGVLKNAKVIIALAKDIKVLGLPTIYIPQPTYEFKPPRVNRVVKKRPTLGFMGFWGPNKGVSTLADVVVKRHLKGDDSAKFLIAGSPLGPKDSFSTHVESEFRKAASNTQLAGFLPDKHIEAFLKDIDALIVPYWQGAGGASSGVVQRAMEYALPIIASRTDYLYGQTNGKAIYVRPGEVDSLEEGVQYFIENQAPEIIKALSLQKQIYRDQSWDKIGLQIIKHYT